MSIFDYNNERREVEELHRLGIDAHREGQYATMERLLEQAAAAAERLDDLLLLIEERYWLAGARRLQGKYAQALSTYTWLIGLANDPTQSQEVRDANSLEYFARAFTEFVESGSHLALPVEQLLRVVDDGLDWLERVDMSNWAAGLRLERGLLLRNQQRWQEARHELEAALALRRRHPEAHGYLLTSHLLTLADLLCEEAIGDFTDAISLAEEVLTAADGISSSSWAYVALAYARLGLHEDETALQAAQQSLTLARSIESSNPITEAYQVLGKCYRVTGRLTDATSSAAQQWHWARKSGRIEDFNKMLADCAQVRLLQVREACSLSLESETLPDVLPVEANRKLAQRRLASTRRLMQRARPFASQLDQARGNHSAQDELNTLAKQAEHLAILLKEESAP